MWLVLALLLAFVCLANSKAIPSGPVKHFVALMMENRAYDHMLGFLDLENEEVQGLTGKEYNHWEPSNPRSRKVFVSPTAKDVRLDSHLFDLFTIATPHF